MEDRIVFNIRLLALLKQKKMSQKKLAEEANMPPAYVSRFLNGTQIPTMGQAMQIADVLDVDVDEIFA